MQNHYYAAHNDQVIYGVGATREEARGEAAQYLDDGYDGGKEAADLLTMSYCTPTLFEDVREFGGGVAWDIADNLMDIATTDDF